MPFKNSMPNYRWLSFILLIAFSCGKPLPVLEGFQSYAWKEDRDGCSGKRTSMGENLKKEKQKLLALSEMDIVEILGRPDQNELLRRNQKFYTYFIEPSVNCKENPGTQKAKRLVVRFNAMGLAKEVTIE